MARVTKGGLTPESLALLQILGGGGAVAGGKAKSATIGGGGRSLLGSLKSIGGTALDVVSVPGATAVTGLTNAIRAAKGDPLVSWKNTAGTFRGSKFAGGRSLLETFGVNKNSKLGIFGGLAADIVIDPTWLIGVGAITAPVKAVKAVEGANSAMSAARALRGFGEAQRLARANRFSHLRDAARIESKASKLASQFGKHPRAESEFLDLATKEGVARAKARAEGFVPGLRLGFGRKTVEGVRIPRGVQIPLSPKPIFKRDLDKVVPGAFQLSPLGKAFAQGRDRAIGMKDVATANLRAELDAIGATDAEMAKVLTTMMVGNTKRAEHLAMIDDMRRAGMWTDKEDAIKRIFTRLSRKQIKQLGWVSHRQQAQVMRRFLQGHQEDLARIPEETDRALKIVEEARLNRLRSMDILHGQTLKQILEPVQRTHDLVENMGNALSIKQRQLAKLEAQLNSRALDPDYMKRLAANVSGRRDFAGWTPKKQAAAAARTRRKQLTQAVAQLRREVAGMEGAHSELSRQLATLSKQAEKATTKLEKQHNAAQMKVSDQWRGYSEEVVQKMADREASANDAVASMARVFAAQHGLSEFTKGRNYDVLKGALKPRAKGKRGTKELSLPEIHEKVQAMLNRGTYVRHNPDPEMMGEVRRYMDAQIAAGKTSGEVSGSLEHGATKALKRRTAQSPFEVMTAEQTLESMVKAGIPADDAEWMSSVIQSLFKSAKKPVPYSKERMPGINWRADMNGYSVMNAREREQYDLLLHRDFNRALHDAFGDISDKDVERMIADITKTYNTKRISGSPAQFLGYKKVVDPATGKKVPGSDARVAVATAWMKAWYTVMNPGHYVMNAIGSFINDLIEGNWRHALRGFGPNLPGHAARKLGRYDKGSNALTKVWKIGDQELTGEQLATYARLSGLGLGYTQAEIEMVAHIFQSKGKVAGVARLMNKFNMDRENADRVWSWMNHMKSGDGPFEAASRVIRAKFDYNAATHFERIWARNMMLFYTWYKNNLIFQGHGLLARPGIYAAFADIENARPKDPAEPSWWKEAGGIYSPFGLLTFGNPMADVFKAEFSQENFRKNVLGALTPFIATPLQLATNKDFFTGADLSKFADQNVPSPAGYVLNPLGVGTPSRARAEGEKSPAVPWYIAKVLKDFTGPYGSSASAILSNPDRESSAWYNVLPRITGARVNPVEPEKWEKSLKARTTKRKADATRKANYEG